MLAHRDSPAYRCPERAGVSLPGSLGLAAGFVLDRAGTLTLDRGGGQALLTILLAAVVASAVAGLMRWARAVAADRASARSLSASPVAPARLHLETRRSR